MKKLFLFLGATSIALSSIAQSGKQSSSVKAGGSLTAPQAPAARVMSASERAILKNAANKTTAVSTRWYNYAFEIFDSVLNYNGETGSWSSVIIWNDTAGKVNYTGGMAHNKMVSVGSILHPQYAGFNALYPGEMVLPTTQPYSIDTLQLFGSYNFNPAKSSVVDTLVISLQSGGSNIGVNQWTNASAPSLLAHYGLGAGDSFRCANFVYDSVRNTGAHDPSGTGTAPVVFKYALTSAMWGDTLSNGMWIRNVGLPSTFNVAAGEIVAASISFKSGDASFPTNVAVGDTIEMFNGNYKYNQWRPVVFFRNTGSTSTVIDWANPHYYPSAPWAPLPAGRDWNEGLYKTLPSYLNGWDSSYVPMWAWSTGGGSTASYLQHIALGFKVSCAGCTLNVANVSAIKNINAFPNPASKELTISYSASVATATVTLTNSIGQVVATQTVTGGKATFNTASLATGNYIYTILANGERSTGNVAIAH